MHLFQRQAQFDDGVYIWENATPSFPIHYSIPVVLSHVQSVTWSHTHVTPQHMPAIRPEYFLPHSSTILSCMHCDSFHIHYLLFFVFLKPHSVQSVTRSHTHVTQHMPAAIRPESVHLSQAELSYACSA